MDDFGTSYRGTKLKGLAPTLSAWTDLIREYSLAHSSTPPADDDDEVYFYNETANVSILCAAAWRGKMMGLAEHVAQKHKGADQVWGRSDLYICKTRAQYMVSVEAKQLWLRASKADRIESSINKKMGEAIANVEATVDCQEIAVGAVFIVIKANAADGPEELRNTANTIVKVAKEKCECDAVAWALPRLERPCKIGERSTGKVYQWPGVIVAMKVA